MRKITKAEASVLIQSGKKGWWAIWANPVTMHPNGYVVQINEDFYDTELDEFKLEFTGFFKLPDQYDHTGKLVAFGKLKQGHNVLCGNEELACMVRAEAQRAKEVKLGKFSARHGDTAKPKDEQG